VRTGNYCLTSESQHSDTVIAYIAVQSTFQSVMLSDQHFCLVEESSTQQFEAAADSSTQILSTNILLSGNRIKYLCTFLYFLLIVISQ